MCSKVNQSLAIWDGAIRLLHKEWQVQYNKCTVLITVSFGESQNNAAEEQRYFRSS